MASTRLLLNVNYTGNQCQAVFADDHLPQDRRGRDIGFLTYINSWRLQSSIWSIAVAFCQARRGAGWDNPLVTPIYEKMKTPVLQSVNFQVCP